jgi:translation initiation factor 2B subunit (eIF-2B alpha/beta/delta family)
MRARGSLEQRIAALRRNRVAGAVDLALEALDLARDWLASGRQAAELAGELRHMHPAIATVGNVAGLLEENSPDLGSRIAEVHASLLEGNRLIAQNLRTFIPAGSKLITLSNSSTVREALFVLEPARVYVMRSLPGGEGEGQAESLGRGFAARGVHNQIEVIPDTAIANVVPLVDCALAGIDSYDRDGAILHKVGTLPLALCCRHFRKPFYAAGHSLKLIAGKLPAPRESGLDATEEMFDLTPDRLITKIVTEEDSG